MIGRCSPRRSFLSLSNMDAAKSITGARRWVAQAPTNQGAQSARALVSEADPMKRKPFRQRPISRDHRSLLLRGRRNRRRTQDRVRGHLLRQQILPGEHVVEVHRLMRVADLEDGMNG